MYRKKNFPRSFTGFCSFSQEFYTQDHWASLPEDWQSYLESVEIEELRAVISTLVLGVHQTN
jgi:hypothetical protein